MQRLEMAHRFTEMRKTEQSERDDNDRCGNGDEKRETAGVLWTEQIERTASHLIVVKRRNQHA